MKWKIHAPNWDRKNQKVKWRGVYGDSYYMTGDLDTPRIMFSHPVTADHFYYVWHRGFNYDIIFASYSVKEVRRFIKHLQWTTETKKRSLYVYDAPRDKYYKDNDFAKRFIRE